MNTFFLTDAHFGHRAIINNWNNAGGGESGKEVFNFRYAFWSFKYSAL